jgi:hypothetical protein
MIQESEVIVQTRPDELARDGSMAVNPRAAEPR